jgi:NUDIX domain
MEDKVGSVRDWTKRYRLAAGVYAMRGRQMLMLERAAGMMIGFWSVPGGLVDPGETPQGAAVERWRPSSHDDALNVLSNRDGLDDFLHWRNHRHSY